MTDVIRFAVLGLGLGAIYALAGQGIVVIYRGSGVINFAQGAIGTAAAYLWWELSQHAGWPFGWSFVAGVTLSGALGVILQVAVMRPLRRASSLVRLVATLGVLVLLQSLLTLRYDDNVTLVQSELPTTLLRPFGGGVVINEDRLWLLADRDRCDGAAVVRLSLDQLRASDDGSRGEPTGRLVAGLVAGAHCDRELGTGLRARRRSGDPRRTGH